MSISTEVDEERLILLSAGHTAFQLLWAGIELGVYDQLSISRGKHWMKSPSPKIGSSARADSAHGLTALGIIKLENERYYNARLIEDRMVRGSPDMPGPSWAGKPILYTRG